MPRDYSKVTCKRCGEKGHTPVRCKLPAPEENDGAAGFGEENAGTGFDGGETTAGGGWEPANRPVDSSHNDWAVASQEPVAAAAGDGW